MRCFNTMSPALSTMNLVDYEFNRRITNLLKVAYILWCSCLVYHIMPRNIGKVIVQFLRLILSIYVLYSVLLFIVHEFVL